MSASGAVRVGRRDFLRGRLRRPLFAAVHAPRPLPVVQAEGALIAQLVSGACLANASQVCTVCVERCGTRGAIRLRVLMPEVDAARCTGCGACVEACPAPEPGLRMVPLPLPEER